jgi:uncharacterized membrane-anchored protein YhcB (DUF1043 family)
METEYWVLSIIAIVLALVAGFIGGRMSAPRQRRVEAMEQERDTAREEAEAVRAEVNRHFEESARMFGKLASDYRTFFQQFAQTAQNLGLSEGRARELLEEADPNLVARQPSRSDSAAPASTGTGEPDAEPAKESAVDDAGADGPTPSADAPEAPAAAAVSASDERPDDGDREAAPSDYEAERDRRG